MNTFFLFDINKWKGKYAYEAPSFVFGFGGEIRWKDAITFDGWPRGAFIFLLYPFFVAFMRTHTQTQGGGSLSVFNNTSIKKTWSEKEINYSIIYFDENYYLWFYWDSEVIPDEYQLKFLQLYFPGKGFFEIEKVL